MQKSFVKVWLFNLMFRKYSSGEKFETFDECFNHYRDIYYEEKVRGNDQAKIWKDDSKSMLRWVDVVLKERKFFQDSMYDESCLQFVI